MTQSTNFIGSIAIALALVIFSVCAYINIDKFIGSYTTVKTQQLKNEAVDGCLKLSGIYEYTNTKDGVKTTDPQKNFYKICLADKGFKSTLE